MEKGKAKPSPAKKAKKSPTPKAAEKTIAREILGKYYYAVGKRKSAIAQVKLFEKGKNESIFKVNARMLEGYFPTDRYRETAQSALTSTGLKDKINMLCKVRGGGISAQADAVRLACSRAIVKYSEDYRKQLRDLGFLTRDARSVERKKPGLKKARRAPQWSKR